MLKVSDQKRILAAEARTMRPEADEYDHFGLLPRRELLVGAWLVKRATRLGAKTFDDVEQLTRDTVERRVFCLLRGKARDVLNEREQSELEVGLDTLRRRELDRVQAEHSGEPAHKWSSRCFSV